MGLFLSTYNNKIDKKGRVSVPAPFRVVLGEESYNGVIAFRSYQHNCIEGCGISRMEKLVSSVDSFDVFSQDQDDITATIFADTQQIQLDGDGRIIIPPQLLNHANITDRAAFVGRGATFQIWNPESFEKHQMEARKRLKENKMSISIKSGND